MKLSLICCLHYATPERAFLLFLLKNSFIIQKTSLVFLPKQFYVLWLYDVFVETGISCSYFAAYPSNVACVFMRAILKKTQIVKLSVSVDRDRASAELELRLILTQ